MSVSLERDRPRQPYRRWTQRPGSPPQHRTPTELVGWLTGVLNSLGIERTHLIGSSYGGWLSMETALHSAERVKKVALVGPAATFNRINAAFYLRIIPAGLLPSVRVGESALDWMAVGKALRDQPLFHLFLRGFAMYRGRNLVIPAPRVFSDGELARIDAPVLHLMGEHEKVLDPATDVARAERLVPPL